MNAFSLVFLLFALGMSTLPAFGTTYTNLFLHTTTNVTGATTVSVVVKSNQIARVAYARFSNPGARVNVVIGGAKFPFNFTDLEGTNSPLGYYGPPGPPMVAGPSAIELELNQGVPPGHFLCVVELSNTDFEFTPSSSVVIPADSAGPVQIILESSSDLITWTAAMPGRTVLPPRSASSELGPFGKKRVWRRQSFVQKAAKGTKVAKGPDTQLLDGACNQSASIPGVTAARC